jgi:hypothetical protein
VQSFALEIQGQISETIVTVGAPPDTSTPTLVLIHPTPPAVDVTHISEMDQCSQVTAGYFSFKTAKESLGRSFSGVVNRNLDDSSIPSYETFATAHEPPLEALLALGLLLGPLAPQNRVSDVKELSADVKLPPDTADDSCFWGDERSSRQESGDSMAQSGPRAPLAATALIRNVGNVNTIGAPRINFMTSISHYDDKVWAGLHTLQIKGDPTACHNSYERQRKVYRQMKGVRNWGSQLLVTSSTTPREFPLSVPRISTRDLEKVVKDVFTWLYAASSPLSIMWLYDEGNDGNSRTSLIAQFLADFLGERRDLTASYFYTKPSSPPQEVGGDTQSIIPTLSLQLTHHIPELETPIALTAVNDPLIFARSLDEQMKSLLVDPLQAAFTVCEENSHKFPRLFLIHGFEDCEDDAFQKSFLQAFGKALTALQQSGIPQKLMLLGPHTAHLRECFSTAGLQEIARLSLLPVSQDVSAF